MADAPEVDKGSMRVGKDRLFMSLYLDANGVTTCRVFKDQPIVLTVRVTSDQPLAASELNLEVRHERRRLDEELERGKISEEEHKKKLKELEDREIPLRVASVGNKDKPWWTFVKFSLVTNRSQALDWPLHVIMTYPVGEEAKLGPGESYSVEFGIDPDDVRTIPSANYKVRVSLEGEITVNGGTNDIQVSSNEVVVEVLPRHMPPKEASKPERKTELASYYFRRGKHDLAWSLVKGLTSMKALLIVGDLHEMRGEYDKAYDAFKRAERVFHREHPDSYEAPELIASRIVNLLRKWTPSEDLGDGGNR